MKKRTTPPTGRRHSGFTLIEMLIVVAIIAILVAVSIPIANSALERARVATDAANERAAKAAGVIKYLSTENTATEFGTSKVYAYDAANGSLEDSDTNILAYGKCTRGHTGSAGTAGPHNENNIIYVQIWPDGTVKLLWYQRAAGVTTTTSGWGDGLHNAYVEN